MGLSEKQRFEMLDPEERERWLSGLTEVDLPYLESWGFLGRPEQQEP